MKCDELKDYNIMDIEAMDDERLEKSESGRIQVTRVYIKSEADAAIAELKQKLQDQCISCPVKMQEADVVAELKEKADKADNVIAELKADYKEACDRLQTANLIKDEQKAKVTKLLGCLKYLVMRDLIKDCPPKKVAAEIVKECDNGLE